MIIPGHNSLNSWEGLSLDGFFPFGALILAAGGQQTCSSQDPLWSLLVDQAARGAMKGIIQLKQIPQYKDY